MQRPLRVCIACIALTLLASAGAPPAEDAPASVGPGAVPAVSLPATQAGAPVVAAEAKAEQAEQARLGAFARDFNAATQAYNADEALGLVLEAAAANTLVFPDDGAVKRLEALRGSEAFARKAESACQLILDIARAGLEAARNPALISNFFAYALTSLTELEDLEARIRKLDTDFIMATSESSGDLTHALRLLAEGANQGFFVFPGDLPGKLQTLAESSTNAEDKEAAISLIKTLAENGRSAARDVRDDQLREGNFKLARESMTKLEGLLPPSSAAHAGAPVVAAAPEAGAPVVAAAPEADALIEEFNAAIVARDADEALMDLESRLSAVGSTFWTIPASGIHALAEFSKNKAPFLENSEEAALKTLQSLRRLVPPLGDSADTRSHDISHELIRQLLRYCSKEAREFVRSRAPGALVGYDLMVPAEVTIEGGDGTIEENGEAYKTNLKEKIVKLVSLDRVGEAYEMLAMALENFKDAVDPKALETISMVGKRAATLPFLSKSANEKMAEPLLELVDLVFTAKATPLRLSHPLLVSASNQLRVDLESALPPLFQALFQGDSGVDDKPPAPKIDHYITVATHIGKGEFKNAFEKILLNSEFGDFYHFDDATHAAFEHLRHFAAGDNLDNVGSAGLFSGDEVRSRSSPLKFAFVKTKLREIMTYGALGTMLLEGDKQLGFFQGRARLAALSLFKVVPADLVTEYTKMMWEPSESSELHYPDFEKARQANQEAAQMTKQFRDEATKIEDSRKLLEKLVTGIDQGLLYFDGLATAQLKILANHFSVDSQEAGGLARSAGLQNFLRSLVDRGAKDALDLYVGEFSGELETPLKPPTEELRDLFLNVAQAFESQQKEADALAKEKFADVEPELREEISSGVASLHTKLEELIDAMGNKLWLPPALKKRMENLANFASSSALSDHDEAKKNLQAIVTYGAELRSVILAKYLENEGKHVGDLLGRARNAAQNSLAFVLLSQEDFDNWENEQKEIDAKALSDLASAEITAEEEFLEALNDPAQALRAIKEAITKGSLVFAATTSAGIFALAGMNEGFSTEERQNHDGDFSTEERQYHARYLLGRIFLVGRTAAGHLAKGDDEEAARSFMLASNLFWTLYGHASQDSQLAVDASQMQPLFASFPNVANDQQIEKFLSSLQRSALLSYLPDEKPEEVPSETLGRDTWRDTPTARSAMVPVEPPTMNPDDLKKFLVQIALRIVMPLQRPIQTASEARAVLAAHAA